MRKLAICLIGLLSAWLPAVAFAANNEVPALEDTPRWGAIAYTAVAVAGIAVVAFKHAKRTHLD